MTEGGVEALNPEQLERLASYFDEEVVYPQLTKHSEPWFGALLNGEAPEIEVKLV